MTHWTSLAGVSLVALSLALPSPAWPQARSRGGSGSSSGGSSSSSPSAGSGTRSGGGDSSGGPRSAPQGGSIGTARPRSSGAASGGSTGSSSSGASGPQTSATRSNPVDGPRSGYARARGSQPAVGSAQPRIGYGYGPSSPSRPDFVNDYPYYSNYYPYYSHYPYYPYYPYYPSYPYYPYYPWYGYYAPWYGYGLGFSIGIGYNSWHHQPYGGYGYYDPYWSGGYGSGGSYYRDDSDNRDDGAVSAPRSAARQPTGSVRFRANPRQARVYVDGALVGTVDDFDGLGDHLEIEAGRHEIELRAEGYETYTTEISVRAGRTITERAKLRPIN